MKVAVLGVALTGLVTGLLWATWGPVAVIPGLTFGLLATAIQVTAVMKLKPAMAGTFPELIRGWAVGMGMRLVGILLIVVAVVANPELFPPLPTAFGYLGVVIPLLFGEIRLSK